MNRPQNTQTTKYRALPARAGTCPATVRRKKSEGKTAKMMLGNKLLCLMQWRWKCKDSVETDELDLLLQYCEEIFGKVLCTLRNMWQKRITRWKGAILSWRPVKRMWYRTE